MDKRGRYLILFLLFLIASRLVLAEDGNKVGQEEEEKQGPDFVERAIGITSLANRWDALATWLKMAWMNLRPPDSGSDSSAGGVMKEAAARSFETSKETVEQAAASAAKVAGEAVEKIEEKLKRTITTPSGDPDAEL